jgi:hypothetical protein
VATTYVHSALRPAAFNPSVAAIRKPTSRKLSVAVWTLQCLLAGVFLMAGAMKLITPAEMLEAQSPLPLALMRFVGLCEVAGALGLLLPGMLRIQPQLTPLAAASLAILMVCATVLTPFLMAPDPVMMSVPATVGALAACVAIVRTRVAPLRGRA